MAVKLGEAAPEFTLARDGGGTMSLAELRGKPAVLFFYPKDDTTGCTTEAKDFSDRASEFAKLGVEVAGVSPDSLKSHVKFKVKHALSVTLLSDETKQMLEAYGLWVEKSMYGKKYKSVERTTLLLDPSGTIARVWEKVKVPGHAEEVLEAARQLKAGLAR